MSDDWNTNIINEFRANEGRVGGPFEGAPMILVHHRGRKSGKEGVTPLMYQADEQDPSLMYIFASAAGAPNNPAWYYNLIDAGKTTVEVGTETFPVTITEVTGPDRDRIYDTQATRYPGFAGYAEKTAGIRTIPVLALRRA
ncbi:nitroreductase family deazaflavin-dependent oxidoreductase [Nocardia sp. ET3-3]|uniref:Nitroreductase family deazaflavin-dependent oxidoreductase n=2 Tax=Nocardia terrae TaxID=2675851 RepID=A0A7K1UUB8_9NOCA|nr:nitroreductase/quinone reductase family protein [Nocardia terrae]MVU77940.1 nitroreductase family deazaflavin-dependent oxidoreductase [Nocardia terrae]